MLCLPSTINTQYQEVTPIQVKNALLLTKQTQYFNNSPQIQYLVEKLNREMNGIRIVKRSKRGNNLQILIRYFRSRR